MTRNFLIPSAIAFLVLAFPMRPMAARASSEPNPWLELHSAHFTVITDAGEKRGREVAFRFEQMRAVFGNLLGKERLNQPVPLTILAFKDDKSYYQLAPLDRAEDNQGQPIAAPGFFLPAEDQQFIVLDLAEQEPWRAVAHDFAHMLLNYNYPPAQGWFDEGLAEYFGAIRLDNKQIELGGDPELQPTIKEDLVGNQRDMHPPESLTELLGAQVWISLPDLFTMKHDTWTYHEGTHHTLYYAESWMVMDYLLHEKKLPETGNYFNMVLNQHVPIEDAIQKAYGMSSAQLEQSVKDYFKTQDLLLNAVDAARQRSADQDHPGTGNAEQANIFTSPIAPDDSAITARSLPEDDAHAIYAAVQIRIPDRREAGLKELKALATTPTTGDIKLQTRYQTQSERERKNPNDDPDQLPSNAIGNEIAHRALAYDYIEHNEFDKVLPELGDAASLNRQDMWVRYYLSVFKYRMAEVNHTDIQGLANMMQDLKAVLEWYPEFADAYDLLAQARKEGGSTPSAMQSERAAMMLSPRNEEYVFHLAQIYIAGKKWDAAQALLVRLKESGNPQLAAKAKEQLEEATTQNKYGIPVGASSAQPQLAPQKSPFDVLDEDAAKRAAAEKAEEAEKPAGNAPAKYFEGRLIAVDCSNPPDAVLTVTEGGVILKLRAADYKSLLLIGADQFSCGWKDRKVTVNYRPGGLTDGDLISLEIR
ncbi:MAG TPA: hypothetical protein VMX38_04805 [Verrucomicrobiae bacterium]|nr:hypothetical protein [Verrucomicrobiae bacterium]